MKTEEVLTRTQDRRLKAGVLMALNKLIAAPQVRDMIRDVVLGKYPKDNSGGGWGELSLTKKGLVEVTGYYDKCVAPSDCSGDHDSYTRKPVVVKPSMQLVNEYTLSEEVLVKILAKLKA